jgi:hypothetical protein
MVEYFSPIDDVGNNLALMLGYLLALLPALVFEFLPR